MNRSPVAAQQTAGTPVVVAPAGLPGPSGGTRYDLRLAREWGCDPVLVTGSWPQPADVELRELRRRLSGLRQDRRTGGRPVLLDGILGCCAPEVVAEAVRAGQRVWIVVHLPLPAETGLDPAAAARLAAAERLTLAAASGVVVTSRWAADDLARRYGSRPLLVAEPGTDPVPHHPPSRRPRRAGPPVLLTPAAFTPRKNHRLLLEALHPLVDLSWTARWVGARSSGGRGTHEILAREVGRRGLTGRVLLDGPLDDAGMTAAWREADLLLLPSLVETYAMVVAEAVSHGIPAVVGAGTAAEATLTGGPPAEAAVPPAPGAALDPLCAPEWTAQLRRWMQDEQLQRTWRERAARRALTLPTWEHTAALVRHALTEESR